MRLKPYLAELSRTTSEALGLPAWVYHDPAVFALEREQIFKRVWIGIGYESEVPRPGDMTTAEYAGWRFIMARGEDGRIRCFHNICRHRGMPVVDGPASGRKTISCPWHMWTYDLEGRLVRTPHLGGTNVHTCAGFDRDNLGLMPVRADAWMGIVFINIDGHAPPLGEYLQPTRDRVAAFDLTLLRESDLSYDHYFEGNWKLALEGGVEDYHIPWVHRQLGPSGDFRGESSGDRWVAVTCRRTMNVARGRFLDPNAGRPLPMFPHLPESGLAEASIILATLPATWIAAVTDHVVMTLYIPETPTRTRVRRRFHFMATPLPTRRMPRLARECSTAGCSLRSRTHQSSRRRRNCSSNATTWAFGHASRPTGKPRCTSSSASLRRSSPVQSSADATLR